MSREDDLMDLLENKWNKPLDVSNYVSVQEDYYLTGWFKYPRFVFSMFMLAFVCVLVWITSPLMFLSFKLLSLKDGSDMTFKEALKETWWCLRFFVAIIPVSYKLLKTRIR